MGKEPLKEKDFLRGQQMRPKDQLPLMLIAVAIAAIAAIFWGVGSVYTKEMDEVIEESPFLQVTNRDMSIFLWQFPDLLPQNVQDKTGYLSGFETSSEKFGPKLDLADEFVVAPPKLLFLYHTWNRLLRDEFVERRIPKEQFYQFLNALPEWRPDNWSKAPLEYRRMLQSLSYTDIEDLSRLSMESLPLVVRMAFQGWKNFFLEGNQINDLKITVGQMRRFLTGHPNYARHFWRNIVAKGYLSADYPNYLISLEGRRAQADDALSKEEVAPFLKSAVFNFTMANEGL